jgi:hypothetical protein
VDFIFEDIYVKKTTKENIRQCFRKKSCETLKNACGFVLKLTKLAIFNKRKPQTC